MTTTQGLNVNAGIARLFNKPSATLYLTSPFSILYSSGNPQNTQVAWSSSSGDNWGGWSSGSPTRYTAPLAGAYELSVSVEWTGNATGGRHVEFYQNGSEVINSLTVVGTAPTSAQFPQTANVVIFQAAAGDYFQVNCWQNSGASLNISPAGSVSAWTVNWLHY